MTRQGRSLRRFAGAAAAAAGALLAAGTTGAGSAGAAVLTATPQWATQVSGSFNAPGTIAFAAAPVTASISAETLVGGTVGCVPPVLNQRNGLMMFPVQESGFYTPAPPADAVAVAQCITGSTTGTRTVQLSKPVIAPVFHVNNLDNSSLTFSPGPSGGALALATVSKNPALGLTGLTLRNARPGGPSGCTTRTSPVVGDSGCGSFALTEAGGPVRSFTISNTTATGQPDPFAWTLSFPAATLTNAFSDSTIAQGGTTQLTFTLTNPSGTGQANLSGVDFADALPSGLTIAGATVTDNGSCGTSPSVTGDGGAALAAGATSVTASNIALAAGATCTITVDVTSTALGTHTSDDSTLSSTLGNVVPDTSAALTVEPAADLSIAKTVASTTATPGQNVRYDLAVRNHGPSDAANVSVTDTLPAGLTFVSASPGCTESGQTVTCTRTSLASGAAQSFVVTAGVADSASGRLSNVASVASETPDPDPSNNTSGADVTVVPVVPVVPVADLAIVKRASSHRLVPGRQLGYELTVTNNGPSTATAVVVSDPLPRGLTFASASSGCTFASGTVTCTAASLGDGRSLTFSVVARAAASARGRVTNIATVASTTRDPDPGNNTSAASVSSGPDADLSITTLASTDHVAVGGQLLYTLVVRNDGPSDAAGVVVTDAPGTGLTLITAKPSEGSCSLASGSAVCRLGTVAAGGTAQVLVSARADRVGELDNDATVDSMAADPDPANNHSRIAISGVNPPASPVQPADLRITKTANRRSVLGTAAITYTVKVTNRGPGASSATQVIDTPNLPLRITSVKAGAGSCVATVPIRCDLGTIASGGSATVKIVAQPMAPGVLRNTASVTGSVPDANSANNLAGTSTTVQGLLKITKTASAKTVRAGATLSYRIEVANASSFGLGSTRVCDSLPTGLVFVSSAPKATFSGGKPCWTIARLGARKAATITLRARALRGTVGRKVSTATATAPNARGARSRVAASTAAIDVLAARPRAGGVTG